MKKIKRLEKQIEHLDDKSFAELREWFFEYEHARWDRQIQSGLADGKLESLIDEALAEHKSGKTNPL